MNVIAQRLYATRFPGSDAAFLAFPPGEPN
jgi:hypothetical protein